MLNNTNHSVANKTDLTNSLNNPSYTASSQHPHQEIISSFIGYSARMQQIRKVLDHIAPFDVNILIQGNPGTGKEFTARYIHAMSGRTGPFISINCGAIPEHIFEGELFGYEHNSAMPTAPYIGQFEQAHNGTLFLDEIEVMPLTIQIKLLRALQERRIKRLGSHQDIPMNCRIITSTQSHLLSLCKEGKFREDLLYRLNILHIDLPTLSERQEDIPALFEYFVAQSVKRYQRPHPEWTKEQMTYWQNCAWPGNVRELRNFADRFVLGLPELPPLESNSQTESTESLPGKVNLYEKKLIIEALQANQFHVANAATQLKIPKKTLYDKLKKIGISLRHHDHVMS